MEAVEIKRHPVYYYEDGNIVFLLSQDMVLYKLLKSQLLQQSEYFKTMFSLPPTQDSAGKEGGSDMEPIEIPHMSAADFDCVCGYLTGQLDITQQNLVTLLNLAQFFDMPRARTFAIEQFDALEEHSPWLQLRLGFAHRVEDWVRIGFRRLVKDVSMEDIGFEEADRLGGQVMLAVGGAKVGLTEYRLRLAYDWPEPVYSVTCTTEIGCRLAWKRLWWQEFAKVLLHPDHHYTPRETLQRLERVDTTSMCDGCKLLTLQAIKEGDGLDGEEEILEASVGQLISGGVWLL